MLEEIRCIKIGFLGRCEKCVSYWIIFHHLNVSIYPIQSGNQCNFLTIWSKACSWRTDSFNLFPSTRVEKRQHLGTEEDNCSEMKRNEYFNPVSVREISCVTDGQTRLNVLSFNQCHHDAGNPRSFEVLFPSMERGEITGNEEI